jgi:hypothetical protein
MSKTLEQISPDVAEDLELLFKSFEMEVIRAINDFERLTNTHLNQTIQMYRKTDAIGSPVNRIQYGIQRY